MIRHNGSADTICGGDKSFFLELYYIRYQEVKSDIMTKLLVKMDHNCEPKTILDDYKSFFLVMIIHYVSRSQLLRFWKCGMQNRS